MGYGFRSGGSSRSGGRSGGYGGGGYRSEGRSEGGYRSGGRSGGYGGGGGYRKSYDSPVNSPVKEGEEVNVLIEGVGEKGDGIAKIKGFVIFVHGAKTGEAVKIKVTKVLSKVGFADVVGKADPASIQGDDMPKKSKKSADKEGVSSEKSDEPSEAEQEAPGFENEAEVEEESEDF